ncbi:MAG: AAA family ATPase, partial [Rudanella sp.]|nr:AAA family ATPase [Rudanella sp.]
MLINSLGLKNFKCFEELDVKFAPITLLTGANSSGKSSLINAILAVLQTEQFPFYLSPNGKYLNMGSFEEMIFDNVSQKDMSINFHLKTRHFSNPPLYFDTVWGNDVNGLP